MTVPSDTFVVDWKLHKFYLSRKIICAFDVSLLRIALFGVCQWVRVNYVSMLAVRLTLSLKTNLSIFCRVTSCHLILCVSFTQAPWKRIWIKILLLPWTSTRQPLIWTSKPVSMMHLHFTFKLTPIYCTFVKLVNELDKFLPIQSKNSALWIEI